MSDNNDRSHPELIQLDALVLTYPGWEKDLDTAEAAHLKKITWHNFSSSLHKLREKQCMHEGDRSHPRLIALDSLAYTYPDFKNDFHDAIQHHIETEYSPNWDCLFTALMETMKKKQTIYRGYRHEDCGHCSPWTKKKHQNETRVAPDLGMCVICLEEPKTHVFVPCGHVCACKSCSSQAMKTNTSCPICRGAVSQSIQLYFS